jgi:hypothetical protein
MIFVLTGASHVPLSVRDCRKVCNPTYEALSSFGFSTGNTPDCFDALVINRTQNSRPLLCPICREPMSNESPQYSIEEILSSSSFSTDTSSLCIATESPSESDIPISSLTTSSLFSLNPPSSPPDIPSPPSIPMSRSSPQIMMEGSDHALKRSDSMRLGGTSISRQVRLCHFIMYSCHQLGFDNDSRPDEYIGETALLAVLHCLGIGVDTIWYALKEFGSSDTFMVGTPPKSKEFILGLLDPGNGKIEEDVILQVLHTVSLSLLDLCRLFRPLNLSEKRHVTDHRNSDTPNVMSDPTYVTRKTLEFITGDRRTCADMWKKVEESADQADLWKRKDIKGANAGFPMRCLKFGSGGRVLAVPDIDSDDHKERFVVFANAVDHDAQSKFLDKGLTLLRGGYDRRKTPELSFLDWLKEVNDGMYETYPPPVMDLENSPSSPDGVSTKPKYDTGYSSLFSCASMSSNSSPLEDDFI